MALYFREAGDIFHFYWKVCVDMGTDAGAGLLNFVKRVA